MENRPEYVITWLGLTKVGVEIALINYNLVGRGLMHCITVSNAKVVVFGTEVAQVSLTAFAAITGGALFPACTLTVLSPLFLPLPECRHSGCRPCCSRCGSVLRRPGRGSIW